MNKKVQLHFCSECGYMRPKQGDVSRPLTEMTRDELLETRKIVLSRLAAWNSELRALQREFDELWLELEAVTRLLDKSEATYERQQ